MVKIKNQQKDFEELLREFDNDFNILKAVIEAYLSNYQKYIDKIMAAIENKDLSNLQKAAHALKGAASNVSKIRVTKNAAKLEMLASSGEFDDLKNILSELIEESLELKDELDKYIQIGAEK